MYFTKTAGIGGKIKSSPEDFIVEEIPLYKPSGLGNHLYLFIEKKNMSTLELVAHLKNTFNLRDNEIGVAGWKDKNAITRQWMSIPDDMFDEKRLKTLDHRIKVIEYKNHTNKLRTAHLKGNKFNVTIRDVATDAFSIAEETIKMLKMCGMPNYYGAQRFGINARNIEKGKLLLTSRSKVQHRLKRMLVSAYSSYLFNKYLDLRIEKNIMDKLIEGDVAKKHETGGLFIVDDLSKEQKRAKTFEISPTGPIFGKKMMRPQKQALELENSVMEPGITSDMFTQPGTRRFLRVPVHDIQIEIMEDKIKLGFSLPAGSYATVLLGEIMKL